MMSSVFLRVFLFGICLTPFTGAFAGDVDQDVLAAGKALFQGGATPACAVCHTLKDAGTEGSIGPDLDTMNLTVDGVKRTLIEGTGVMPSFAGSLSDAEIDAVAQYVVNATSSD